MAVFGDLPIATKIVQYVLSNAEINLSAVIIGNESLHNNDPWLDTPCLVDFCMENGIETISLNEFNSKFLCGELDLGLACRFSKIIKKETIDVFKLGIINMHGGLLPEFAGLYSCNMSILYGAKRGGGTLHYIDERIDTGDILRRCEFDITEEDTGYTVFQKTQMSLYENMIDIIPQVLHATIKAIPMSTLLDKGLIARYFDKKSIFKYKEIRLDMSQEEIVRIVRAFDFPGYEPAFIKINGEKIYMRTSL